MAKRGPKPRPPEERNSRRIMLKLPPDLHDYAQAESDREGISLSEWIRRRISPPRKNRR